MESTLGIHRRKIYLCRFKKGVDFPPNMSIMVTALEKCVKTNAPLAQLVEHLTLNQGVQGSSP